MKATYAPSNIIAVLLAIFATVLALPALADSGPEGAWRLVSRVLPDGTKQAPPEVMGLATWISGQRNLNVVWHTPDGKVASYSLMSTVKITATDYTETLAFSLLNDPSNPQGPILNSTPETKTVPVKREGGRVSYKLPFDAPAIVIDGDKLVATAEGMFVDYWERIK
jgi:hypothetical protein